MLAKEIMACIQSKIGDLDVPTLGHLTASFDYGLPVFLLGICIPFFFYSRSNCCLWYMLWPSGMIFYWLVVFYVDPSWLGSMVFHFLSVCSGMGPSGTSSLLLLFAEILFHSLLRKLSCLGAVVKVRVYAGIRRIPRRLAGYTAFGRNISEYQYK
jgi:hypothetical protein